MKKILSATKDFKIIPENYKNSGSLQIIDISDEFIKAKVILEEDSALSDYSQGVNVEVFGANDMGLVYFETKIAKREDDVIYLEFVPDYSIIQRREYSRVVLDKGSVNFPDLSEDIIDKIEDISAGGIRFVSRQILDEDKIYKIEVALSNNMKIACNFQPVRNTRLQDDKFLISGKFLELSNFDRVVLVQYAFKIKMEEQNKNI